MSGPSPGVTTVSPQVSTHEKRLILSPVRTAGHIWLGSTPGFFPLVIACGSPNLLHVSAASPPSRPQPGAAPPTASPPRHPHHQRGRWPAGGWPRAPAPGRGASSDGEPLHSWPPRRRCPRRLQMCPSTSSQRCQRRQRRQRPQRRRRRRRGKSVARAPPPSPPPRSAQWPRRYHRCVAANAPSPTWPPPLTPPPSARPTAAAF